MEFIKIGKNEWCTEDARFTRDRNGEVIHMAKSIEEWAWKIAFTNPLTGSNESGFTALPGGYLEHVMMATIFMARDRFIGGLLIMRQFVSEYDKCTFTLKAVKNTDRYFDLKHSAFKEGNTCD